MKVTLWKKLPATLLLACLFLNSCGNPTAQPSDVSQQNSASPADGSQAISSDAPDESLTIKGEADNEITIAVWGNAAYEEFQKTALPFNWLQSEYQVTLKRYGNPDLLAADIMRGEGADLFFLRDLPVEALTQKGILEDLTPYFTSSDTVHQEDLLNPVWKAGIIDDKMTCLIPAFYFEGIIVEKGHTVNGAWTISDYLSLAEQYPNSKICQDIGAPQSLFLNDLLLAPELYIDWEAGTCSFTSDDFIEFLEGLKEYSEKKYDITFTNTPADMLYNRHFLTYRTQIMSSRYMCDYISLNEMLGDEFELAGFPGLNRDEPHYRMIYPYALGMNAFSEKKEGAWAFLEYLLSESVQEDYAAVAYFPARLDTFENMLQEAININLEEYTVGFTNPYTEETERLRSPLTEEEGTALLDILDHVERFSVMNSGEIAYILIGELKLFFDGSKTAEEAADIIQNRVQVYLDEMR